MTDATARHLLVLGLKSLKEQVIIKKEFNISLGNGQGARIMDLNLVTVGLLLVLAGFVIGLLSLLRPDEARTGSRGEKRGGGVIIIGFIPIIFGSDPKTKRVLLILSVILVVVLIGLFLLGVFA